MTAIKPHRIELVRPSIERLPAYTAALIAGWSPNTMRDVSSEQLAHIRRDPEGFLLELTRQDGDLTLPDGTQVPRLPSHTFWIWDGEFCGAINFRFARGTEDLPSSTSGHIGYSVVPGKRERGYAKDALAQVLAVARREGFTRVMITCDEDNLASRRIIEANGGKLVTDDSRSISAWQEKAVYWVPTESHLHGTTL